MNRIPFNSFHSSHFNSNNLNRWNFYLQFLQQYQYDPYTSQCYYHPNENEYKESNQYEEKLTQVPERNEELSKEAIAIFEFSEAYAKQQKEEEELNTEREDMEINKTNWILDEYTDYHDNGIEAPVTSLVILSKQFSDQNKNDQDNIHTQEHLLNSTYLQTCHQQENDPPLVIWPVLPLRL
ncbi:hypothetical protein BJ944DRAFT_271300, partial [Cunninghamella echinulata]